MDNEIAKMISIWVMRDDVEMLGLQQGVDRNNTDKHNLSRPGS